MRNSILIIAFLFNIIVGLGQSNQPVLYVFSGSDWCIPCMEFKKDILEDSVFVSTVGDHVLLEVVDFPQKTRGISKSELARRDSLAALYNEEGAFPKVVLVQGTSVIRINHHVKSANTFLEEVKQFVIPHEVKAAFQSKLKMGSHFSLHLCNGKEEDFKAAWDEIDRIENSISSWKDSSEISSINRNAGFAPVKVSKEVMDLIVYCMNLHSVTQGAFDISIKPGLKIWDWKKGIVPSDSLLKATQRLVNLNNVVINEDSSTVYLKVKGMSLDLGSIGKGYSAMKVAELWKDRGIESGVINAGGDLYMFGEACDIDLWSIGIKNPFKDNEVIFTSNQTNVSVATSGDYERYFEVDSVRYSHIIDPKTLQPVKGMASVTVFASNPVLADALATALSVLGVEAGKDLINQMEGVEAIIIQHSGKVYYSKGVKQSE